MQPCQFDYAASWLAQSWYLKEIIPPVGEPVTFSYERGPYLSDFSCVHPERVIPGATPHESVLSNVSGVVISPVYLTAIDIPSAYMKLSFSTSRSNDLTYFDQTYANLFYWDGGTPPADFLDFHPTQGIPYFDRNPDDKYAAEHPEYKQYSSRFIRLKLDEIRAVYTDSSEGQAKIVSFGYDENAAARLKLEEVSLHHARSETPETYRFEYNHELPDLLKAEPEYLSEYGDAWGFSNQKRLWKESDKTSAKQFLPERAKLGVLSKVIYPTQGYTLFFFENHEYGSCMSNEGGYSQLTPTDETLVSGLRVRKIVSVDGTGGYTWKEYLYKDKNDGRSSGILHTQPTYFTDQGYIFDNSGSHVTYSGVTEKYADGSFKYTDFVTEKDFMRLGESAGGCLDDTPVSFDSWDGIMAFSERDLERGKVLDEYYCNASGQALRSVHYSYTNIGKNETNSVRTVDSQYLRLYFLTPGQSQHKGRTAYYHYCYKNLPSRIREFVYDSNYPFDYRSVEAPAAGSYTMTDRFLEYDSYGLQVKETEQGSDGISRSTVIRYAHSLSSPDAVHTAMTARHLLAYPVVQEQYCGDTFLGGTRNNYAQSGSFILPSSQERIFADGSSLTSHRYLYNGNGSLYEDALHDGRIYTYMWDYCGRRLMGVTENVSSAEVSVALGTGEENLYQVAQPHDGDWWETRLSALRTAIPKAHVVSYGYEHSSLVDRTTRPTGASSHYCYDSSDRLQAVLDNSRNTLRSFSYRYATTGGNGGLYLSRGMTVTAYKQCPAGYSSQGSVQISASAGECISTVSQADADRQARELFQAMAQERADRTLSCMFSGEIVPESSEYVSIHSHYLRYESTDILLSYLMFDIQTSHISLDSDSWYTGVPLGHIGNGPKPERITYQDISDGRMNLQNTGPNLWTIWIDTDGTIWIRLKDRNSGRLPDSSSMNLMAESDLAFPLN